MKIINVQQRSPEWLQYKIAKIGGTRIKEVFKSDNLTLIDLLIAEKGSQQIEETKVTYEMQRGIELEPYVIELFEKIHNVKIKEIGICESDEFNDIICSPDGFTEDLKTGIEIKCPSTKNHVKYIRMGKLPAEYKYQVLNYFLVNEKCEKMYFITFDDRYKPKPYFEIMIKREDVESELSEMKKEIAKFTEKLNNYEQLIVK